MKKYTLLLLGALVSIAPFSHPCDGKALIVRLYVDQKNPGAFDKLGTVIEQNGFLLDIGDSPKGAVLAVVTTDQPEPDVAQFIGSVVQTWRYVGAGPYSLGGGERNRSIRVSDALGVSLANASVQARLRVVKDEQVSEIQIGPWQSGPGGQIDLPQFTGELNVAEMMVVAPNYGTALVRFPLTEETLKTGLVAPGTPEYERALRGTVLGPDRHPISGAIVTINHVRTPGEGLIQNNEVHVLTDVQGRFAVYMPVGRSVHSPLGEGTPVPPHSRYAYRVEAPRAAVLPICVGEAYNDEECTITFEAGSFHTFAFEDTVGRITAPERLDRIAVSRKNPRCSFDRNMLRAGIVLAPGEYSAEMFGGGQNDGLSFPAIEVTAASPTELVFSLPKSGVVVSGQVFHAVTKSPIAGVFVSGAGGLGEYEKFIEDFTPEDWRLIEALPVNPGRRDLANEKLQHLVHGDLVRTDQDGRFRFTLKPGRDLWDVGVWARDFLHSTHRFRGAQPNAEGVVEVGAIPMFPAGMVSLTVTSENDQDQYVPDWKVEESSLPEWAKPVLSCMSGQSLGINIDNSWRRTNKAQNRYVPAGLSLKMEIRSANPRYHDFVIPRQIRLAQGQHLDLGSSALRPAIEALVTVTDETGRPYEGAPVRVKTDDVWNVSHNTDAKGVAIMRIAPDATGVFAVLAETREEGVDPVVASTPFASHDGVGAEGPFTIVLPSEDAARVFSRPADGK